MICAAYGENAIAVFFVINHVSCKRLNFTQLIKDRFRGKPQLYYQYNPRDIQMVRDLSYLPEDDYDTESEAQQNELQSLDRDNRGLMPKYQDLCEKKTRKVELDNSVFEYQPSHYIETFCKNYPLPGEEEVMPRKSSQQKCAHPKFECVQRSRSLLLSKRRWDSDCWEPHTIHEVASGCDCMWPVTSLGDIRTVYRSIDGESV
ncbi:PREDICTED: uncharacterized protein LOC106749396 isoform X2 [Dinoponera quadriceps]|uniref:Uncharacterized protein LOC106749396 isoform X2 n=1 Tax=Dinoponera quadriceps TaxID=609295 RepID=A0A6P3Y0G1_DINQU|nr:PREDICTED: uncharacterized protein LOC106749396 isoform X2 [Dinoponera quadriceps]